MGESQGRRRSGDGGNRLGRAVWGRTSTRLRKSGTLREPAIAAYRLFARVALAGPPPKVFANSIPKAGTHLLTQLLSEVPRLWFSGVHVTVEHFLPPDTAPEQAPDTFVAALSRAMLRIRNGQYATAHMGASPLVSKVLEDQGFVHLLMIRDPRDIVVSRAFYRATNERLRAHGEFASMSDGDRLMAAITGLPAQNGQRALLPVSARFERHRGWLRDPSVSVIRFEDLVGPRGGGTEAAQRDAIRRVLTACRRDASDAAVDRLTDKVFAKHAATFRRGAIGDWRNHLTQEHLDALETASPGALADFGYE